MSLLSNEIRRDDEAKCPDYFTNFSDYRFIVPDHFYLILQKQPTKPTYNRMKKNDISTSVIPAARPWSCRFLLLLMAGLLCLSLDAAAQSRIHGVVRDAAGQPIAGANILVVGTSVGTTTDISGGYTITVPKAGDKIAVSFIGYTTQVFTVGTQTTVNVELKEDSTALDDVVVVGYGVQKKASVTGSIASVKGNELKQAATANLSNALAGRMPGVIANTRSGEPGADGATIYIRGTGSLNNSSALIVIDGVANREGGFDRLNPNDIESITVLKDASAAIYGAQAANGVILITTKRGTSGKPTITYDGSFSLSQPTRLPNLMNAYQYMNYDDEANIFAGLNPTYENIKGGYLDGTINRNKYGDTDWFKATLRDFSPETRHSVSISGGTDNVKYYVSGAYTYQEPNFKNTVYNFQTAQIRSNIDAQISKNLKVGVEIAARQESRHNSIYSSSDFFYEVQQAPPFLYDYYPNGLPGAGLEKGNNLALYASGRETGYDKVKDLFLNTKASFDWQLPYITKGLSLGGFIAFDKRYRNQKTFMNQWDCYQYNDVTGEYDNLRSTTNSAHKININQNAANNWATTINLRVNYERTFGDHSISAFVAYEQYKIQGEGIEAYREGFISGKVDYLKAGGTDKQYGNGYSGIETLADGYINARQNIFGRINYSFKNRYLLEFTLRHDGSLNFPKAGRWGTFPGVSIGWRMGEEAFIKDNAPWINELKLRASWGQLGNDRVNQWQYLNMYWSGASSAFGDPGVTIPGFYPSYNPNTNITWEVVDTKNIGIEGNFWDGLLTFDMQYFHQKRSNILAHKNASVPDYTGLALPDQNFAKVTNQGFELELNHFNKVGDWTYHIGGNFSFVRNKINFIDEASTVPQWQKNEGHSMGAWMIYQSDGIYQNWDEIYNSPHMKGTMPGDIKYVDIDGNGEITDNDRVLTKYRITPEIVYGINMGFSWKGLELNMLWTGQANSLMVVRPMGFVKDQDFYDGRWISAELTPDAKYPRAYSQNDKINNIDSDFWLKDASFLRLKNLELAYTLPQRWTKKARMNTVRVYVTGNNLFTIDNIKLMDPESNNKSGMYYPQQRTYTLGVNISF